MQNKNGGVLHEPRCFPRRPGSNPGIWTRSAPLGVISIGGFRHTLNDLTVFSAECLRPLNPQASRLGVEGADPNGDSKGDFPWFTGPNDLTGGKNRQLSCFGGGSSGGNADGSPNGFDGTAPGGVNGFWRTAGTASEARGSRRGLTKR